MSQSTPIPLSLPIKIASATSVFVIILITHTYSPVVTITDSGWFVHTAMSLIQEGNGNLDEYRAMIRPYYYDDFYYSPEGCEVYTTKQRPDYQIKCIYGSLYDDYPIGVPLSTVPYLFVVDLLSPYLLGIDNLAHYLQENRPDEIVAYTQKLIASSMVATTGVFLFLTSLHFLSLPRTMLLIFIFAFCTPAWTTASRAIWQHTPTILIFSLVLYLIFLSKKKPYLIQFIALPLALSYVIRPTNAISILLFTLFVLIQYPRFFIHYCLWATTIAISFFAYNLHVYEALRSPYYSQPLGNASFLNGAAGVLFSPSRGLFIYSSVFLFSLYGIFLRIKSRAWLKLDICLALIIVLHGAVISFAPHWWGGSSIGPRFFTDMVPYLIYFLIPVVGQLSIPHNIWSGLLTTSFFTVTLISFMIQAHCVTAKEPWEWNGIPEGDLTVARLWDWSDPQFLRGLNLKPAQMNITPTSIYITRTPKAPPKTVINLTMSNMSEYRFTWEARTPFSIKAFGADVETSFLIDNYGHTVLRGIAQPFSNHTIAVQIDMASYKNGIHNLGGIEIIGYLDEETPVENSPMIIPITLDVLPTPLPTISTPSAVNATTDNSKMYQIFLPLFSFSSASLNKISHEFSHPSDILLNNLPMSDPTRVIYGLGWYPRTDVERPAQLPATIYIDSPKEQIVQLEATLTTNIISENLTIYANQAKALLQGNQLTASGIFLKQGWNIVTLKTENNYPATFSVTTVNIITEIPYE